MFEEPNEPLSPAGLRRQEEIRQLAQRFATRKRWRRRAGRAALAPTLVAALVWWALPSRRAPTTASQRPVAIAPAQIAPPKKAVTSVVTFAATDPTITNRWSIAPSPARWTRIDDHQLLAALADAGLPAGLVNMDGRSTLMFHSRPTR